MLSAGLLNWYEAGLIIKRCYCGVLSCHAICSVACWVLLTTQNIKVGAPTCWSGKLAAKYMTNWSLSLLGNLHLALVKVALTRFIAL